MGWPPTIVAHMLAAGLLLILQIIAICTISVLTSCCFLGRFLPTAAGHGSYLIARFSSSRKDYIERYTNYIAAFVLHTQLSSEFGCRGEIFSHSEDGYLTWGPASPEADLRPRPSMHAHNRDIEKSSGQATQFSIWTIWAMDRTSAQPQVNRAVILWNFSSRCSFVWLDCFV